MFSLRTDSNIVSFMQRVTFYVDYCHETGVVSGRGEKGQELK